MGSTTKGVEVPIKTTYDGKGVKELAGGMSATNDLVAKHMREMQRGFKKLGTGLSDIGKNLTAGVTLPIVGFGALALNSAMQFETAFADVRRTVDGTEQQFASLKQGIIDMANKIPVSREEIANVAAAAGQLGIKTENVLGFTEVMVKLGSTTNMTSNEAADALARLANITQMPQTEFGRLGSTLVALGVNMAATESDITQMSLRIAGAGHQVGLTEPQIMAFAAALSSVGIEAESGGSSMSRTMINISQAVNAGGKDLANFAKVAGQSSDQFANKFKTDAAGAIIDFINGLQRISKEGGNVFGTLEELGLNEIRVRDALLRAAGSGDLFSEALKIGNKAWEENNALNEAAEKRYATAAAQMEILKNKVTAAAMEFGGNLSPILLEIIDFLQPLIDGVKSLSKWFSGLSDPVKKTIVGFLAFAAAMGPTLFISGKLILSILQMQKAFVALRATDGIIMKSASKIASGFKAIRASIVSTSTAMLSSPIFWIIAAIVALGIALFICYKKFEGFRKVVDTVFAAIRKAASWAWDNVLKPVFQAIGSWITGTVIPGLKLLWQWFVQAWNSIKGSLASAWTTMWPILKNIAIWIGTAYIIYLKTLAKVFIEAFKIIGNIAVWLWNNVLKPTFGFIKNVIVGIWPVLKTLWSASVAAFKAIGEAAVWLWNNAIKPAFGFLKTAFAGIWTAIKFLWNAFGTAFSAIGNVISGFWDRTGKRIFVALATEIQNKVIPRIRILQEAFKIIFAKIGEVISWWWNNVTKPVFNWVVGLFRDYVIPYVKFMWSVWSEVFKAIGTVVMWLWNNVLSKVFTFIGWIISNVVVPYVQMLWKVWSVIFQAIGTAAMWVWNNVLKPVFGFIGDVIKNVVIPVVTFLWNIWMTIFNAIGTALSWVWNNIIKPVFNFIIDTIVNGIIANIRMFFTVWAAIFDGIAAIVSFVWNSIIKPAWDAISWYITQVLIPGFQMLWSGIQAVWNGIVGAIQWAVNVIKNIWEGLKVAWNGLVGFFQGAIGAIGGVFSTIADVISGAFRGAFNFIARAWNNTVGSLSWTAPDWIPGIGGKTIQVPDMPTFAKGGVVPGVPGTAVPAILHAGERVLRRTEFTSDADPRAKSGQGNGDINVYVNKSDADPYEIGREMLWALKVAG